MGKSQATDAGSFLVWKMAAGALEPCFYKWGHSQPAGVGRRAPRRSSRSASRPGRAAGCRPHGGSAGCQSGALSRLPAPLPSQTSARPPSPLAHSRSSTVDSGVLATSAVFPGRVDSSAAPGPGPAPSQTDQVGLCGMSCWLCFRLQPWGHPRRPVLFHQGSTASPNMPAACQGFICVYLGGLPRSGVPCEGVCSQTGWQFPHPRDKSWGPHARVNKAQALNPSTEPSALPSSAASPPAPWPPGCGFGSC